MNVSTRASDRAWVEVDLANLIANARCIQSAAPGAQLLPMVKANAYGLGVRRVVDALDPLEPWGWGVATVTEGVELREAGATRPVVVFTPARVEQFPELRRYDLRPVLDRKETIEAWRGPYHLEIDTGMGRGGMVWRREQEIRTAIEHPPEGVFTHFHSADERPDTVETQMGRFRQVLGALPERPRLVHAGNSAGAFRIRDELDLVRPGIFLYGGAVGADLPSPLPVASVRGRIVSLRRLEPGDTVSYGAEWSPSRTTVVGTIGIGYADGVMRAVKGKAQVLLGGDRRPIVGRVTMDMIMVDLGPDSQARVGDVVTLLGRDGDDLITIDEVAGWAGTISYEVLVGLGNRLPREYASGG